MRLRKDSTGRVDDHRFTFVALVALIFISGMGTFALGIGNGGAAVAPQAALTFDYGGDVLVVTHEGGDVIRPGAVTIVVDGESYDGSALWGDEPFAVGETRTIRERKLTDGGVVRIVWTRNGDTFLLAEWRT